MGLHIVTMVYTVIKFGNSTKVKILNWNIMALVSQFTEIFGRLNFLIHNNKYAKYQKPIIPYLIIPFNVQDKDFV